MTAGLAAGLAAPVVVPLAAHADPICSGLDNCLHVDPVVVNFILAGIALVAIAGMVLLRLRSVRKAKRDDALLIGDRDWPVAKTRMDGRIELANAAFRELAASDGVVAEALGPVFNLSGTDLYRLSRLALRAGFTIETVSTHSGDRGSALVIQSVGGERLIWQVVPREILASLTEGTGSASYNGAPFGYLRLSAVDDVMTNDLFREILAPEAVDILREQVDNGIFSAGRAVLPAVDGSERLVLSAIKLDRGAAGDVCEIFLFLPDPETRNQVSASDTLEAVPVALLHLDVEGRVTWGNGHARNMLADAFAIGAMLGEIVQPLGRPLDGVLDDVRNGHYTGTGEMMRLNGDKDDVFLQITLTHMVINGQPSLMAVLTDASELRMLEDKFAQSQKMEAVGKLAGGVAHDFNNVLTAISGHCDLLLLRKDASHPDFSDLTQIRQNSNRAATLVRQLLAFSRKQTLQPKLLSVHDVVSDTLYLLDRLIGETITLSLDHGRELGSVRADHQQLEQALMNLVVNARDAMPDGGTVTIATRNRIVADDEGHLGVVVPRGDYVEISVADSGGGIDPAVIDRIFDPFFTTKPVGEGTGLGLSTVYGIVKQSGGYIYAENPATGGAKFTILLRRATGETADLGPEIDDQAGGSDLTGQGAVMLVEDEAPVRSFASRALRLRGYQVVEANSAEEAMELLKEHGRQINVLVSDVVMPGMDGPTFAASARKMYPELRVVFISGYAEDSFRRNLSDGDFLFLSKPFSLNDLTSTVKVAMSEAIEPRTHA